MPFIINSKPTCGFCKHQHTRINRVPAAPSASTHGRTMGHETRDTSKENSTHNCDRQQQRHQPPAVARKKMKEKLRKAKKCVMAVRSSAISHCFVATCVRECACARDPRVGFPMRPLLLPSAARPYAKRLFSAKATIVPFSSAVEKHFSARRHSHAHCYTPDTCSMHSMHTQSRTHTLRPCNSIKPETPAHRPQAKKPKSKCNNTSQ